MLLDSEAPAYILPAPIGLNSFGLCVGRLRLRFDFFYCLAVNKLDLLQGQFLGLRFRPLVFFC